MKILNSMLAFIVGSFSIVVTAFYSIYEILKNGRSN